MNRINIPEDHPLEEKQYIIPTSQVAEFTERTQFFVENDIPGIVAYGIARIGKTTAINVAIAFVKKHYRGEIAVMDTTIDHHKKGENLKFYREMCDGFKLKYEQRWNASQVRSVIIEHMLRVAKKNQNRILLIVDEASLMLVEDYGYLMDIYNRLEKYGVKLKVILVGTEYLAHVRNDIIASGESQIIGRFMATMFKFHPVQSAEEVREILEAYDNRLKYRNTYLTEDLFPEAFAEGKRLADETDALWAAVVGIAKEINKVRMLSKKELYKKDEQNPAIPIQYIILSVEMAFKTYGKYGSGKRWLPNGCWEKMLEYVGGAGAVELAMIS